MKKRNLTIIYVFLLSLWIIFLVILFYIKVYNSKVIPINLIESSSSIIQTIPEKEAIGKIISFKENITFRGMVNSRLIKSIINSNVYIGDMNVKSFAFGNRRFLSIRDSKVYYDIILSTNTREPFISYLVKGDISFEDYKLALYQELNRKIFSSTSTDYFFRISEISRCLDTFANSLINNYDYSKQKFLNEPAILHNKGVRKFLENQHDIYNELNSRFNNLKLQERIRLCGVERPLDIALKLSKKPEFSDDLPPLIPIRVIEDLNLD